MFVFVYSKKIVDTFKNKPKKIFPVGEKGGGERRVERIGVNLGFFIYA